ncbi:hypothetical protein MA16_Dca015746 [Dendrobium catenatum]|uniref:Uncharacterized protein n=1 Tax=Dendrobium catenatum TaxID=906689 RepID=A0A2I0WHU0_9ASPA|nr:hypothetical protein MA16_Dca015746 [Dendrobium catenatum]
MKRWKVHAFGNWENCDEMPITRYFDSVSQAGTSFFGEEDLFKVPVAMPMKHGYPYGGHCRRSFQTDLLVIATGRLLPSPSIVVTDYNHLPSPTPNHRRFRHLFSYVIN